LVWLLILGGQFLVNSYQTQTALRSHEISGNK
jgi:hypothetical protein